LNPTLKYFNILPINFSGAIGKKGELSSLVIIGILPSERDRFSREVHFERLEGALSK
jgi:hypothetical protein